MNHRTADGLRLFGEIATSAGAAAAVTWWNAASVPSKTQVVDLWSAQMIAGVGLAGAGVIALLLWLSKRPSSEHLSHSPRRTKFASRKRRLALHLPGNKSVVLQYDREKQTTTADSHIKAEQFTNSGHATVTGSEAEPTTE